MSEIADSKRKPVCETQSSTSTSESGLIEDVEIIDGDEELEDEEGSNGSMDNRTKKEIVTDEEDLDGTEDKVEDEGDQNDEKRQLLPSSLHANPISDLTEEQIEELFSEEQKQGSIMNLIIASFLLFTVPIGVMYSTYKFLFKEKYNLPDSEAALYSGIIGVFLVYVIVCVFIWVAYREEKYLEKRYKEIKSQ